GPRSAPQSASRTPLASGTRPTAPNAPPLPPRAATRIGGAAPPPPRAATAIGGIAPMPAPGPAPVLAAPSLTDFAAPTVDNLDALKAHIAARTAERDAAAQELARVQPVVAEVNTRLAAARRKVAEVQEKI